MEIDDRITAILSYLGEDIARIYTQKKLNELDKETGAQDWNKFVWEIKTTFSNKIKVADAEWKIEIFKQGKKNTADFMIEFKMLAMKTNIDKLHAIFLLKKNVWADIIKMILGYLLIAAPETLKEWKVVITSVGQGYESTEGQQDYRTESGMLMDIGKSKENFKNRKFKWFNCNIYRYLAKNYKRSKKERDTRKCYKCKWVGHITKDCRTGQKMKNWNVQDTETDTEKENKRQGYGDGSK